MSSKTSAVHRFCRLPTPSYEKIFADANSILDDIISQCHSFRKPNQTTDTTEMISLISHGCDILQNASILLRSKFAQVVNIYLPLIKRSIDNDEAFVNNLVSFLCQSLANSKSTLLSEFMKALAMVLVGHGSNLNEDSVVQLLGEEGVIWFYLPHNETLVKGYAIQCVGNVCLKSTDGDSIEKDYIRLCYSKLLDCLRLLLSQNSMDVDILKLIGITLKALQNVLSNVTVNHAIVEPEFAVALLKTFLAYGMSGYKEKVEHLMTVLPSRKAEDILAAEKIYPTKKKEKSTMTKKINVKKTRKNRKRTVAYNLEQAFDGVSEENTSSLRWDDRRGSSSSSESDFSDVEQGSTQDRLTSALIKIRYNAALTLKETLRCCDRRAKFSCWLLLIPDNLTNKDPSLVYSLAMDHVEKVQSAIVYALMELIDGSKGFLDSAVSDIKSLPTSATSFTPFSVKLSHSLNILHDTLLSALDRRQASHTREKLIKCLTLFMLNAPYRKISIDYLPDIVCNVSKLLQSGDTFLTQSALTCIAASMSVAPHNVEVEKLLQRTAIPSQIELGESRVAEVKDDTSWIVIYCLQHLVKASQETLHEMKLTSECIQLLTVILRCHPNLIKKRQRDRVIDLSVNIFLFSGDAIVTFHTIKMLEEFSKYFVDVAEKSKDISEGVLFWKNMLSGVIPEFLHSTDLSKAIKAQAAVCDWISNMGACMFEAQKTPEQIYAKTVLIGLSASEEPVLAAAAVRALGVLIQFTCMRDDVWFIVDVTRSIFQQLDNPSVSVRLKAAWSLANLIDFITKHEFLASEYPESLVLKLLQYSTKAALDNEKVSTNGVRALGNLLKLFPKCLFDKEHFKEGVEEAITALVKNIRNGSMKTRWNACYACRYIFENHNFPIGEAGWSQSLYDALIEAFDCRNFKVRISAAAALCSPPSRGAFGDLKVFLHIWREALNALESSEELTDFTEYKHKDNLQNQLTMLLLHLLSLCTTEDIPVFRQELQKHGSVFFQQCERCVTRIEGQDVLVGCSEQAEEAPPSNGSNEICGGASKTEIINAQREADVLDEEPDEKLSQLDHCLNKAKANMCLLASLDQNLLTMEVLQTTLNLVR